jgi:hypothetical protein
VKVNGNGTAVPGADRRTPPAARVCTGNGVKRKLRMRRAAAVRRYTAEIRSGIIFTECVIVKFPSSLVEPFLSGGSVRTRRFDDETKVYHTRTLCHSDPRTKHRPLDRPSAAAFCCRILLPHSSAALRLCVLRPETLYQAVCQTLLRRVTLRRCRPADAASPMNLRVPLHGGRRRIILIIIEESRPRS